MRTIIRELKTSLNTYTIVYDEQSKMYFAINQNDIDENGKLTKEYNGITGHANEDINDTINSVIFTDKIKLKMSKGYDFETAFMLSIEPPLTSR